jgi:hypothetical protein
MQRYNAKAGQQPPTITSCTPLPAPWAFEKVAKRVRATAVAFFFQRILLPLIPPYVVISLML